MITAGSVRGNCARPHDRAAQLVPGVAWLEDAAAPRAVSGRPVPLGDADRVHEQLGVAPGRRAVRRRAARSSRRRRLAPGRRSRRSGRPRRARRAAPGARRGLRPARPSPPGRRPAGSGCLPGPAPESWAAAHISSSQASSTRRSAIRSWGCRERAMSGDSTKSRPTTHGRTACGQVRVVWLRLVWPRSGGADEAPVAGTDRRARRCDDRRERAAACLPWSAAGVRDVLPDVFPAAATTGAAALGIILILLSRALRRGKHRAWVVAVDAECGHRPYCTW